MNALYVLVLCVANQPLDVEKCEYVDIVEYNSYYDVQARLILKQLVFWNFQDGHYVVHDWRLCRGQFQIQRKGELTYIRWHDGDILRRVKTSRVFWTWTQFDPEVEHRKSLAKHLRPGLRK